MIMNEILWENLNKEKSNLYKFINTISEKYSLKFEDFKDFHKWSVDFNQIFWLEFLNYSNIIYDGSNTPVYIQNERFQDTTWFPNLTINFAENLLRVGDRENDKILIISAREDGKTTSIKRSELISKTLKIRNFFKKMGINKSSKIAVCLPNIPETIYIMLAATSLGACFSSSSPDFGASAIYDRFSQFSPDILFVIDSYYYKGKKIDKLKEYSHLSLNLKTIQKTIVVPYSDENFDVTHFSNALQFSEILEAEDRSPFERFPFSNPVYTMYSSGTTGLPKCMVQGSGVLINHLKEHLLHLDLKEDDTIFYFTTCGWMMWNWMVSSLFVGSKLFLYEGNPFHPGPEALWKLASDHKITVFGTSAGYLSALEKTGYIPIDSFPNPQIRTILSTGSPLLPEQYDFVYSKISHNVQLSSISGGTDLNGCFVLGNPLMPVRRGEIQGKGLGMKVEIWNEDGKNVIEEEGELVCTKPFPSMPVYFDNDVDGTKYYQAYFQNFPNVWRHGDYGIEKSSEGFILLGRSDATLNPGGVRIGTAEIYRIVEKIDGIIDSLAIGITIREDEKVILFVKLNKSLEDGLEIKIRKELQTKASPRHIPYKIIQVQDIPYTRNMKKVELIIKNLLEGKRISNKESLHNPEVLDEYLSYREKIFQ